MTYGYYFSLFEKLQVIGIGIIIILLCFVVFSEMGENITETVTQMKDTMVESVNNVTNSIGDVIGNEMKRVPLKDTMDSANHMLEENMESYTRNFADYMKQDD